MPCALAWCPCNSQLPRVHSQLTAVLPAELAPRHDEMRIHDVHPHLRGVTPPFTCLLESPKLGPYCVRKSLTKRRKQDKMVPVP